MANETDTAAAGADFDGTPGNGEILFAGTVIGDDSRRAILHSTSVTTDGTTLTSARAVLAPDLASATGDGPYLEIAIVTDAAGFTSSCCQCVVPAGWSLYFLTTEDVATDKKLFADWSIRELNPRF